MSDLGPEQPLGAPSSAETASRRFLRSRAHLPEGSRTRREPTRSRKYDVRCVSPRQHHSRNNTCASLICAKRADASEHRANSSGEEA
jgi:hypothetical protein